VPAGPPRIDVHCHAIPDFLREALAAAGRGATISTGTPAWSVEHHLATMAAANIGTSILSISQPGVHFGDDGAARRLARRCNEFFAELRAKHPGRFGTFAVTPLPDIAGARDEIADALDVLRFDGIGVLASYGEKFLGDPAFDPVLEALNARGAAVHVHPSFHPASRGLELKLPGFLIEFPFDTTRAAVNLIFSGTLERFPNIRFILSHAGGTLPFLAARLKAGLAIDPNFSALTPERIEKAVRHFWYDTALSTGPAMIAALNAVADPARILFGSDFPYAPAGLVTSSVSDLEVQLDAQQLAAIGRDNAVRLFPRFAAKDVK
jgi:predicted TIM-barrel fold metal-dependent hydrolase